MSTGDNELEAELRALLAEGRKIEAIKRYREETGAGLAAAKEAVEAVERGEPMAPTQPEDLTLETDVVSLLEQGRKIDAIKLYRERTGTGLKEAKDAVDAIAVRRRINFPSRSGCLGVLLFVALLVAGTTGVSRADKDELSANRSLPRRPETHGLPGPPCRPCCATRLEVRDKTATAGYRWPGGECASPE